MRRISPAAELKKAQDNNMFGNFGSARVFILGGGVMPPSQNGSMAERNGYRDPKTLTNLKQFWDRYFLHSNAQLVEFGAPALIEPLAW